MDIILPYNTQNREHFCNSALKVGFHEFVALKMLYTMKDSDLDVFQLMGRERLDLLFYGFEVCQMHWDDLENKNVIPPYLNTVLKQIVQYSLDIWLSKEWEECRSHHKAMLLVCIKRAKNLLQKLPGSDIFNWEYALRLGVKPWDIPYLNQFMVCNRNLAESLKQSSEHVEAPATVEDIQHLQKEGLALLLLRLIKLFDGGIFEGVRKLSMRIIAAWNHEYEQSKLEAKLAHPEVKSQHKTCLILICHIYLMAIYEMDDIRGFVIDNVLNNIRFYYRNMIDCASIKENSAEQMEYTPARYIAITCINLQISSNEFIDAFIYDSYDENFVSLFGVISQSYMSYLLGHQIMEMNKLNEDDFNKCIEDFKRVIHLYIIERERSEEFMMNELHKKEMKRRSHSLSITKENLTCFYTKMCKGNRLSNIGSTEHTDGGNKQLFAADEENERRVDPVFQNLPNNSDVLNYVYTVLVKRTHRGWYFAKLIVLLKIIGLQLNAIETWRYHPGLTPEFLLNLEVKLSKHFEDLALIFQEHLFMEQEFWLTGFYLNPCKKYYETVIRSGMRANRLSHRFETGENYDDEERYDSRRDRREKGDKGEKVNAINAKYGLLSSTIDVKEIVKLANHDAPEVDYGQLCNALRAFKLPENTIKDLLTVIFLPRNKSFAWALNWVELRKRCKSLLKDAEQKRHFIELNMAEANDRLKFLKIDYEKYKHRPQLDYGSIEQGYENTGMPNFSKDSSDENEDEDSEDFEADSDLDEPAKHEPKKTDHSLLFDTYFMSTRRTRARAAAMIANVLEKDEIMSNEEKEEDIKKSDQLTEEVKESVCDTSEATATINETKRDFNEILNERKVFSNSTSGFNPFPDIWSLNGQELKTIENNVPHLETSTLFNKSAKLEVLKTNSIKLLNEQKLKYKMLEERRQQIRNAKAIIRAEEAQKFGKNKETGKEGSMQETSASAETNKDKTESFTDLEMHEDESDVSTTARRDSDEVNDLSKDEQMDQSEDVLIATDKERQSPEKAKNHAVAKNKSNSSQVMRVKNEKNSNNDKCGTTASTVQNESHPTEQEDLLKLCMAKKLRVRLRRLTVADVQKLRQPSVRLQRMNLQEVANQMGKPRRAERKVYIDLDETSKSSNNSFCGERTLTDTLKRRLYSSESSTESDEFNKRRRGGRAIRGKGLSSGHVRTQRGGQLKSLKVTPRSASGLKFRISTSEISSSGGANAITNANMAGVKANSLPVIDYIQISSSSSSDELEPYSQLDVVREEEKMDAAIDPLYEEEIPIFRL
ncbi:uncharacterized protein LOC128862176 [Anastrepha ludens]|uniref:uncharacterized protein LOC128862176 n=1 Tax=Anastrepha ludens TaxID=28586 RepID=UPI0023AF02A5|nr:uncharacterized protein LOC128862176 [Anastrepha ludens]